MAVVLWKGGAQGCTEPVGLQARQVLVLSLQVSEREVAKAAQVPYLIASHVFYFPCGYHLIWKIGVLISSEES